MWFLGTILLLVPKWHSAEIDQKKKKTFWGWEFQKQKIEMTMICISFKNLLTKQWPEHRPLRKRCLSSELFWSVFSHIRTESECGKIRTRKLRIRTLFTHCVKVIFCDVIGCCIGVKWGVFFAVNKVLWKIRSK